MWQIFIHICIALTLFAGILWCMAPFIIAFWVNKQSAKHVCTTGCDHSTLGRL